MEHNHLLSTHLQSKSVAIGLTCYPNICYQTHLLSTQLWSHLFAIKPHLLSRLNCYLNICYQTHFLSTQLWPHSFAIKPHLLLSKFAINSQLQSTILPLIIICYKIFDFLWILTFFHFFLLKICNKWKYFTTFWIHHSVANFACGWNWLILLSQVKVSTF